MIGEMHKSRRDLLLGGAAVAAGAVVSMAGSATAQPVSVRSRQTPQGRLEIEKSARANRALAELHKIDSSLEIEWVKASNVAGTRRIVQMKG